MPRTRLTIVALALACAGCTGAPAGSTASARLAEAAAAGPKPSFQLTLDGIVTLPTYASDGAAALSSCEPSTAGGWSYLYAGGTPFVSLDLSVYPGAVDGTTPGDFDLDIGAPTGQVRLVPSGRREGAKGTGTVVIDQRADAVTITVTGAARTMVDGGIAGDTSVDLTVTCPR